MFALGLDGELRKASGMARSLRFHGIGAIEAQVRAWFAARRDGPGGLPVGAVPFDVDGEVARGDGEGHVALRCVEIEGRDVVLQAGAGIFAASDHDLEVAGTGARFQVMLAALGLDERGPLLDAAA